MKIKAYTSYSERNNTHYYTEFDVINELPEINSIEEVSPFAEGRRTTIKEIKCVDLDCEQGSDSIYNYKYFEIVKSIEILNDDNKFEFEDYESDFVAIKIETTYKVIYGFSDYVSEYNEGDWNYLIREVEDFISKITEDEFAKIKNENNNYISIERVEKIGNKEISKELVEIYDGDFNFDARIEKNGTIVFFEV